VCDIKNREHKLKLQTSQWEPLALRRAVLSLGSRVKRKLDERENKQINRTEDLDD
jgi:hypothetical protein